MIKRKFVVEIEVIETGIEDGVTTKALDRIINDAICDEYFAVNAITENYTTKVTEVEVIE